MDTIKIDKKKTMLISDGGSTLNEIDNTYPAFLASCNRTYDGILCHIRFTKDRHIVTSRKRSISQNKIHISRSNYDELLNIEFKEPHTHITTLLEVLAVCKRYKKALYIKLCPPIGPLELNQLYQEIVNFKTNQMVTICSNDERLLKFFRDQNLTIKLELEIEKYNDYYLEICQKYHYNLIIPYSKINRDLIDMLHSFQIVVGIKEINNPIEACVAIENNIDYFYTKELE